MTKVHDREVSIVLVTSTLNQSLNLMKKICSQLDGLTIFRIYFYKNRNNTFSQLQSKNISLKFLFFSLPSHKLGSWNQSKSFLQIPSVYKFTKRTASTIVFLSEAEKVFEYVPFLGSRSLKRIVTIFSGPTSFKPLLIAR